MPKKVTPEQREKVLRLLAQGQDRETIAAAVGVTPGQVSAVAAHVAMGTYRLPEADEPQQQEEPAPLARTANLLRQLQELDSPGGCEQQIHPILLGADAESGEPVYWNPDPAGGTPNPHVLILGESGTGKTYAVSCLTAELAHEGVVSIIFDYGQGFSPRTLPREFVRAARPVELHAGRDGIDINPLQIFPSDLHGPVNVAQRVADTFSRVYKKIGVQQHAVLRQAVIDVMAAGGIRSDTPDSWSSDLPTFGTIQDRLTELAADTQSPNARFAASAASHVSTIFVFNTFRPSGHKVAWTDMLAGRDRVVIIQLQGLEHSLERAVTEFLLWNLIGFIEALGPGPLRCFVVLDEAHKLSFDRGSPVEKLLREGRKFGLGLILASQQPEDFSPVAFANTATKIVFQVGDERSTISRQLHRKVKNAHSFGDIYQLITKLPRGCAYVVSENIGRIVHIASFQERTLRWAR
jgi:DNA phosphorothioation-dependent restriction protein DptH